MTCVGFGFIGLACLMIYFVLLREHQDKVQHEELLKASRDMQHRFLRRKHAALQKWKLPT